MPLPGLIPVLQHFPDRSLPDVAEAVLQTLAENDVTSGLTPGARVAVACGSRGITNLASIVRTTISWFHERGFQPFIVPAMGSHGGGTPEGQRSVLAHYGITEDTSGCPIVSSMDVVELGTTPDGIETVLDRAAFESDGIFLVNRIKWHTTFEAPIESGLMKMAAIGLGKLRGAEEYHRNIVRMGFEQVIRSTGRHVLASGKVLGGLAILEDAYHNTGRVEAIPADRIEQEEAKLLEMVKAWMPRILFDEIDILIVDEIGKHISGVGMDSKVINRHPYGAVNPWPWLPRILRIYVRDLSPKSYGNANGLGMADMISERLHSKIDWHATKVNALTACNLPSIRTPLRASSDREALDVLSKAVGRRDASEVTVVWIRNTMELTSLAATENLVRTRTEDRSIEQVGPAFPWEFDGDGNLSGGFDRVAAGMAGTR